MDKENLIAGDSRITSSYRAAKPHLLTRKRSYESLSPIPFSRSPLISSISLSSGPSSSYLLLDLLFNGSRCSNVIRVPLSEVQASDQPIKVPPAPSALDDELDDSFLQEIDAICEQNSAVKEQRPQKHGGVVMDKYSEYLQKLNDEQREAACADIAVPLMIIAGPGSGKTSTMVGRVLTLLQEGIAPANILAMTFTTAAASEMRDRIGSVVGKKVAKELSISTFHSFCLQLCRSHAEKLGRTSEFLIYGHGQQRRAVIEALRLVENEYQCGQDKNHKFEKTSNDGNAQALKEKSKKWQKFVTQAKASGKTPEDCEKMGDKIGAEILRHYSHILASCNALDYHDFISSSVKLLTDFPKVYQECLGTWKAILVDEFQDTSSMQYCLLRILSSHNHVTIVGDEDQSIYSFNGADICGFSSFREDFPTHKEIRLKKNYRSTGCIVEAASSLIYNNANRCKLKQVVTDNSIGSKIIVKECHSEDTECAYIVDKILEITSENSTAKCSFGNIAILYRRQVSGKAFQMSFRNRKIPFNVRGVAFYRKKVIRAIMSILKTTLPGCDDNSFQRAFKALLPCDKEEKKKIIEYVEKVSTVRNCSFISAASDIFAAKISGTFKRTQLTHGRKVLSTLSMLSRHVQRERSISVVISSTANMLPQKYLLEQRAVVNVEGGKLLNEDNDLRSVLQFLLDDVSDFLSAHFIGVDEESKVEEKGCLNILKAFIDYISERETENFRSRRQENGNSVTLTTIHQSKGLEWDVVFIVKANDSEIPLLHEFNGIVKEGGSTLEAEAAVKEIGKSPSIANSGSPQCEPPLEVGHERTLSIREFKNIPSDLDELTEGPGNIFLKRFKLEDRTTVSHLFHQWAKKSAFQHPKRLLDKVCFVIDERLRNKLNKHKDTLRALKSCLNDDEAFQYAQYVLRWEKIPIDKRIHLMREKQEHFQKQRIETSMGSLEATPKQIAYLHSLGCTIVPTSRLHASRLIEQYKSL
ncbi:hypothetical protein J5N97_029671 [Dioscorea zingiberensis]|uniref:DNA 3'-5' helicase n=1 Tax=Dioscorea zingiberensis TaxID=325984 RepID=A0A9D5BW56_9LILI|nr:hypothetical protein J5N97_029671 [Dioscorea zingiberensis]